MELLLVVWVDEPYLSVDYFVSILFSKLFKGVYGHAAAFDV